MDYVDVALTVLLTLLALAGLSIVAALVWSIGWGVVLPILAIGFLSEAFHSSTRLER